MDQKLKNYSSGMQVRLAFSVATRAEADILLVDEVLAVGDADFQRKCYDYFKSLKQSGKTVVFVTHDMSAVREYCDRAILISEGLIAHQGDADMISNEYLKLFNQSEYDVANTSDTDRWGNNHVSFTNVTPAINEKEFTVTFDIVNNGKEVDGLNLGVDIHDQDGSLVTGTELIRDYSHGIKLEANERRTITLSGDNIFGGGKYIITASLRLKNGMTTCDYWKGAASFVNSFEYNQYFPVVMPSQFKIEQEIKK
jgi:ABC-2 type transport system ATP-binding protein